MENKSPETPAPDAKAPAAPTPEAKAPEAKSVVPANFTKKVAIEQLNKAVEFYGQFIGKRGYNPHFKLNMLQALGERLNNPDTEQVAIEAVYNLPQPKEADVITNQKVVDYDKAEAKKEAAVNPATQSVAAALKKL